MMTKHSTTTSVRSGHRAISTPSSMSGRNNTGHLTLIVTLLVIVLALGWGLFESIHVLTTGVLPRF